MAAFGRRLRRGHLMRGMTLAALADAMCNRVTRQALCKYEQGRMMPDSSTLIAMCDALGLDADYFFRGGGADAGRIEFAGRVPAGAIAGSMLAESARHGLELVGKAEFLCGVTTPPTLAVEGAEADVEALRSRWEGTALWRATADRFRPGHKRRNWYVGVTFISPLQLPAVDERDIRYETCRAGGAGGQNVNKVKTAVRAVHTLTGEAVRCERERSQSQNRARAREMLLLRLAVRADAERDAARHDAWGLHTDL